MLLELTKNKRPAIFKNPCLVEHHFQNIIQNSEVNYDEGIDPELLLKMDAISLQFYLQHFLLAHSGGNEHWNFVYKKDFTKHRKDFLKLLPGSIDLQLPLYTPDLTPHQYMDKVIDSKRQ